MPGHRIHRDLQESQFPVSGATAFKFVKDEAGNCLLSYGTGVPSGVAGYAVGALFIHTDGGSGTFLYQNTGTAASCTFTARA